MCRPLASLGMVDIMSREKRSRLMAQVRRQGNKSTELRLIALMRVARISGWRRGIKLPGRPDFVFLRERVAVFVDGDFWHGHPKNYTAPASNSVFWALKVRDNKRRDRKVDRQLKERGWRVLRIWESSLQKRPDLVRTRLLRALDPIMTQRVSASVEAGN